MEKVQTILRLPEGNFYTTVNIFQSSDILRLQNIYTNWKETCELLTDIGCNKIPLPVGLSKTAFCLAKGSFIIDKKISGIKTLFDCYDPNTDKYNNRIKIKTVSIGYTDTTINQNSYYDRFFFIDFYKNGILDGSFDIYEIPTLDIHINTKKSKCNIYNDLIKNGIYLSKETYNLF